MHFASWKERKHAAKALKLIYQANNADQAAQRLEEFDAGAWGQKYPAIAEA
jgi:transposase-like protein